MTARRDREAYEQLLDEAERQAQKDKQDWLRDLQRPSPWLGWTMTIVSLITAGVCVFLIIRELAR